MSGVGRLAFLVREACVSFLMRGTRFLLSGVQWSAMSFEMGLCVRCEFGQPVC